MAKKRTPKEVYQLRIDLAHAKPPIWRRVLVVDTTTLSELHAIIQLVMPWDNSHLHGFYIEGSMYSDFDGLDAEDASTISLADITNKGIKKFDYEYDFGDSWGHVIKLEKPLPLDKDTRYPQLTAGKQPCPPEDSGGLWGYYEMLEIVQDPAHPDHDEYKEWLGDGATAVFELADANARLEQLRK
ncbi:MAG: plasmid pRiA4b ORF-3 family protein [Deinococcota bacterium]